MNEKYHLGDAKICPMFLYIRHAEETMDEFILLLNFTFTFIIFKRFYLFIHERHRERGKDTDRGRSREPDLGPIPGLQDHALG